MASAEIIAIGTELLLGEIQDTNTSYLARHLRDAGIDVFRATIVGDNETRIAQAIQDALQRADIVITTGGLGPTVDDPTRQAVARAVNTEVEFRDDLWEQIQERFRRFNRQATKNNRRQAYIPVGAVPIENPVGTAPAFLFDTGAHVIISLPGVPREMEYLWHNAVLPQLKQRFPLMETIQTYVLHTAGVGESQVDEWIGDLETSINPTVGLAAHPGQIDIRITAKGRDREEIEQTLAEMAGKIRRRVGEAIYGAGEETLEQLIQNRLVEKNWRLVVVECGLNGQISHRLKQNAAGTQQVVGAIDVCDATDLRQVTTELRQEQQSELAVGATLQPEGQRQNLHLILFTPDGEFEAQRSYGGPPQNGIQWAANTVLDFLRRKTL